MFVTEESIRERCLCASSKRVSVVKPERFHSWWLRFCHGKERHPTVSVGMPCYGRSFQATAEELPSHQKLSSGHRQPQKQVSEQHCLLAPGKHHFPSLCAVTHFKTSCPIAITKCSLQSSSSYSELSNSRGSSSSKAYPSQKGRPASAAAPQLS